MSPHVTSIKYNGVALPRSAMLFTARGCESFKLAQPQLQLVMLEVGVRGALETITPCVEGRAIETVWEGVRFEHVDTEGSFVFFGERELRIVRVV